ncbi:AraC family transcriptional regulator [Pseudoteredinibacter isoporae]|uniref:AraC-like DNA-binding protein n=1 Tax=Pseudoteredinibacter isoporae TaxID=570281 RepID=A0A7X0MVU3_9GAMM|nr:AraC family transcriptional regulator [Pseudoteredinibacter isoporae]MBB6521763.1 AraC-like DNA-binding protein [Pseudoteredinibacter isoporae]NHO87310.1 AraC family transcriptional regulator [Pseudoteredinibacter isoporae]NIB23058.1 AraC family transcriptional regulator [Pseudoteredinibacter isoporae]
MTESTLIPNTPSTTASWAQLIAKAIESYGLDSRPLFEKAGIDIEQIKAPNARVPVYKMEVVWRGAVEQCEDPAFALTVAKHFQPNAFSAIGMAMASSSTLLEGLRRCIRFYRLTSDGALLSLNESAGYIRLLFEIPAEHVEVTEEAMEAFIGCMVQLFRSMLGADFSPAAANFIHHQENETPYQQFFNCKVGFGEKHYELIFNKSDTEQELLFANPNLGDVLDEWMTKYLARFQSELLSTKVRAYLLDYLIDGDVDQKQVAEHMGMSARAMQRKLKEEGSSFSELLDACRLHFAEQFLRDGKLTLAEITFMLGFSDQSNFSRAFKRWTGTSPQQYRSKFDAAGV